MIRLKYVFTGFLAILFVFVISIISCSCGKLERAKKIQIPPEIKEDKIKLVDFYRNRGDIENMISTLQEAIKKKDNPWLELTMLGDCYVDKKQFTLAEETLEKAIKINPNASYIYKAFGRLYLEEGEYEKASEYLKKALEIVDATSGEKAHAYYELARLNYAQGDIKFATRYIKMALSLFPEKTYFKAFLEELEKK